MSRLIQSRITRVALLVGLACVAVTAIAVYYPRTSYRAADFAPGGTSWRVTRIPASSSPEDAARAAFPNVQREREFSWQGEPHEPLSAATFALVPEYVIPQGAIGAQQVFDALRPSGAFQVFVNVPSRGAVASFRVGKPAGAATWSYHPRGASAGGLLNNRGPLDTRFGAGRYEARYVPAGAWDWLVVRPRNGKDVVTPFDFVGPGIVYYHARPLRDGAAYPASVLAGPFIRLPL